MKTILLLMFLLVMSVGEAKAEESGAPKASVTCVACHGPKGISANPLWPNIAGQKPDYIMKQLNDFKAGRRNDPLMSPIAKSLSEEAVKELAKYFSSLQP